MTTVKTLMLTLTACAILNVLNTAAMACVVDVNCEDDAAPMPQVACAENDPGCAVPEELACNAGLDCKVRVLRGTTLTCNGSSGDGCKVAPMPRTLLACQMGGDCVAIAILPPPEIVPPREIA